MKQNSEIVDIFGTDVFNQNIMQQRLNPAIYDQWRNCIETGTPLELSTANEIAKAMKEWAIQKGATHYTHWFQPMTGITAEKHEAFLEPDKSGKPILNFTGNALVCGEPDASAFPSGGLRATFEARGYTAWDPTSFVFVRYGSLYIPTCFLSYTGAVLDKKTPLLRSVDAVSREALRILRLFGDCKTKRVIPLVGAEQEYFLLPKQIFDKRLDLRITGRTLFGATPPKGQELDDHYFGTLRTDVSAFMKDLDTTLWRLGIYSKTKHNEAAPCQHELASIYSDVNTACDANQLIMQVIQKTAAKHGLVCVLQEKPFHGVNGSGKHNNWSLSTDQGINLFSPGETPQQNAQFLLFLAAFIKGVDQYQDLLRASAASAGNDLRLGACEAPPAIISIYLGDELEQIVHAIIYGTNYNHPHKNTLRIGVDRIPNIPQDTTDRNRTSPLAFTGNKFEFRMVGSSQSIASANTVLNTIMAEVLGEFAETLEKAEHFDESLQKLICTTLTAHEHILFNGNGYSEEWIKQAQGRGLYNLQTTPDALSAYKADKNIKLLAKHHILSEQECCARYEIYAQAYQKTIHIEAKTCINMIFNQILPSCFSYSKLLSQNFEAKKKLALQPLAEQALLSEITMLTNSLYSQCKTLEDKLKRIPTDTEQSLYFFKNIREEDMKSLRETADQLERIIGAFFWPYPSYSELLYY